MFISADNSDPVDGADPFRISTNDPDALRARSSVAIVPIRFQSEKRLQVITPAYKLEKIFTHFEVPSLQPLRGGVAQIYQPLS
jgi:hypothetical protein